ncbi:hypothetical protein ABFV99_14045 [Cytobacillus horneckiae]|uniref:hypothetical protein n=1 Tax=Cytobacillus horneckiae TaxID=549687 RepID=UPI0034CF2DAF
MNEVTYIGYDQAEDKHLVFVICGDIETDAVVDLANPHLHLSVPEDLIETGSSLAWLDDGELLKCQVNTYEPVTDLLVSVSI